MSRTRAWVLGVALIASLSATIGCVSRDEFLRTDFARRKAVERNEALERDLADERNRTGALESEREALRRELDTSKAMTDTYRKENERLAELSKRLQGQMDDVLGKGMPPVEVVEVKLPAELDKALKEFASKHPDAVEYDATRGAVRWKSDLTFEKGSDQVRPAAMSALQEFARIVNSAAASAFEVVVVGHTDNLPIGAVTGRSHPTNWHLSVHRAISVMEALARSGGIDYHRLGCMGYGEFHPREPNPARGGNEANRRVEIFLVAGRDPMAGMQGMYQNHNDGTVYGKMEADPARPAVKKGTPAPGRSTAHNVPKRAAAGTPE